MKEMEGHNGGGKVYKVVAGQFALPSKESDPKATKRTYEDTKTKETKTVWEKLIQSGYGQITGLKRVKGGEYGDELHLELTFENEPSWIRMKIDSGYALDVMKRMLNKQFDFSKPCILNPMEIEESPTKKKYYMMVVQDEVKILSPFTKEYQQNPNNKFKLPEWKEVIVSGKKMYDKSDVIEFLWYYCNEKARRTDPMFKSLVETRSQAYSTPPAAAPVTPQYSGVPDYQQQRDAAISGAQTPPQQQQSQGFYTPPQNQPPPPPVQTGFGGTSVDDDLPF